MSLLAAANETKFNAFHLWTRQRGLCLMEPVRDDLWRLRRILEQSSAEKRFAGELRNHDNASSLLV